MLDEINYLLSEISGQLENFSGQVLHCGGEVHPHLPQPDIRQLQLPVHDWATQKYYLLSEISGQLQNFSGQVLHGGSQVHARTYPNLPRIPKSGYILNICPGSSDPF